MRKKAPVFEPLFNKFCYKDRTQMFLLQNEQLFYGTPPVAASAGSL